MTMSLPGHNAFFFANLFDTSGAMNPTLIALALAGLLMLIRKPPNRKEIRIRVKRRD